MDPANNQRRTQDPAHIFFIIIIILSWQNCKKFYKNNYKIVAIPHVIC